MRNADATVTVEAPSGVTLQSHRLRVEIIRGPLTGKVFEHQGPEARIGSGPDCDIVLPDKTVSHHHATLRIEGDAIRVLDARSRNGTLVDNVRIRDAFARPDSTITTGASMMRFRMIREVIELPLSSRVSFGGLLGGSLAMRRVYSLLERISPTNTTVLLLGETGTGKEVTASAIHQASRRSKGPFVVFDCSAASGDLIGSELFGHVQGAFTGAVGSRNGRFREADGGTLFLDEIGELPLELQPKLLRAIEARTVRPLGSERDYPVNVRIIAATNRNLKLEMERDRFRDDLYYRLAVMVVDLPPLRERVDDVPALLRHFEKDCLSRTPECTPIADAVVQRMKIQPWPGNVRELRNKVELMLSLGLAELPASDLDEEAPCSAPVDVDIRVPFIEARDRLIETFTRSYFEKALRETNGNVSRTAQLAKVGRAFVQKMMRQYQMPRIGNTLNQ